MQDKSFLSVTMVQLYGMLAGEHAGEEPEPTWLGRSFELSVTFTIQLSGEVFIQLYNCRV